MDAFDRRVFADLFSAVVARCFGHPLGSPLSESESKHLSNEIEDSTGLVIGWRSLKNYALFLLNPTPDKPENPSIATLDTLARYVLGAPVTSEAERKKTEEHCPYWFRYREQARLSAQPQPQRTENKPRKERLPLLTGLLLVGAISGYLFVQKSDFARIVETFQNTNDAYLKQNGWFVQAKNPDFWNRRSETPGRLTLFTLNGDTWPKAGATPRVQNLLLRKIHDDCFQAEVHFDAFVPGGNWQQAGLLLVEDTLFTGKSIRLSVAYNDYFGGYDKPAEILIQAIASYGRGNAHLEEFVHQPLFPLGTANDRRIAATNLKNVAFRIEKQGSKFRFLYSTSPVDNFSFKEVTTYEFGMAPKYIGLFALKGFVDTTAVVPVRVRYFRLDGQRCE